MKAKVDIVPIVASCELGVFLVNGINADYNDFGTKEDRDSRNAEPYCCANMTFEIFEDIPKETLNKYGIDEEDFICIGKGLEKALSFGTCRRCS